MRKKVMSKEKVGVNLENEADDEGKINEMYMYSAEIGSRKLKLDLEHTNRIIIDRSNGKISE